MGELVSCSGGRHNLQFPKNNNFYYNQYHNVEEN